MQTTQVPTDVLGVLSQAVIAGSSLRIELALERALYTRTNKVLEAAGGKWNRSAKAHIFEGSAEEAIDAILLTGEVSKKISDQKKFQFFPTPAELAKELLAMAGVRPGMRVFEPQAGGGNIAREAAALGADVFCNEIQPDLAQKLQMEGIYSGVTNSDFLAMEPSGELYDAIVANPPFALQADIKHSIHAMKFLKPGAPLVTVMSAGVLFREDRLPRYFRDLVLNSGGSIKELPTNSFKASGTSVNSVVVQLRKQ